MKEQELLDSLIVGRIDPHIYAFTTETIPNYLKVGDTTRPVVVRLNEWRRPGLFPNLKEVFQDIAKVDDDTFFRDFAVHQYLENIARKHRLTQDDLLQIAAIDTYFSNEFFEDASKEDVIAALEAIKNSFLQNDGVYQFYNLQEDKRIQLEYHWSRTKDNLLRPNQEDTIKRFKEAIKKGRKNLLMYAVMRFGKTFTSLCCAKEMEAKFVVVVSAKADVRNEWKQEVEQQKRFEGYVFLDQKDLLSGISIRDTLKNSRVVLFLTLQDLQGEKIKEKHKELFSEKSQIDLLIIDETHFAARAAEYGKILQAYNLERTPKNNKGNKDSTSDDISLDVLDKEIKHLTSKVRLHLSGTPYRILMSSEFDREKDIIAFVQATDIMDAKKEWEEENQNKPETEQAEEWENPYFGFPQMVRFAFNLNESARKKLKELEKDGKSAKLSELFEPCNTKKLEGYDTFKHEQEVFDLLQAIDGSKEDDTIFPFLNYEKIRKGKMCRHIVFVLPWRASCDAMEKLLKDHRDDFKTLSEYEIINISGLKRAITKIDAIKTLIKDCEAKGQKTITLTVNKMLTGCTVPEWDTMVYLKDSQSPQEYDQATFRIQSQYVRQYETEDGKIMKQDMKPQTLLVDFSPERMFVLQQQKAFIFNVNSEKRGNENLEERLRRELEVSPVILFNKNKIQQITPTDIIDAIRSYNRDKSVQDEALGIGVDMALLNDESILREIEQYNELGSNQGLREKAAEGEGGDIDIPDNETNKDDKTPNSNDKKGKDESIEHQEQSFEKKFQSFYANLLYFAFLTKDKSIRTLNDIIKAKGKDNNRIFQNLGLNKEFLVKFRKSVQPQVLQSLEFKINNIHQLANDDTLPPLDRALNAMKKFGRMSISEIVTPADIADEMVAALPEDAKNGKILDIASKQGEFAIALWKRFGNGFCNKIYAIPTSPLAYEFTRKIFNIIGIPTSNIFSDFTSYDLINSDKKDKIIQKLKDMKFNMTIGNPPYQQNTKDTSDKPIYHLFYNAAFKITDKDMLISPARFLYDAGKTPSLWNRQMVNDIHLKVVWARPTVNVFDNVDIKGGVSVVYRDTQSNYGKIGVYSLNTEVNSIKDKVLAQTSSFMSEFVYPPESYKFTPKMHDDNPFAKDRLSSGHLYDVTTNIFVKLPEIFLEQPKMTCDFLKFYGRIHNERVYRYIKREYIVPVANLDSYKVFVAKSNGEGIFGETLTSPIIAEPSTGHTQTFISIGNFSTKKEAEACLKYIKTKFARTLLGVLKVTQDNKKSVWKYVPLQDFTPNSDIDWSKPVADIDQQLYSKYGLTKEEMDFIESMVKPME